MSRKTIVLSEPKIVFGVLCDNITIWLDHLLGYFIQGEKDGEPVLDRDAMGMATVASPLGFVPLKRMELVEQLELLNEPALSGPISAIMLGLKP